MMRGKVHVSYPPSSLALDPTCLATAGKLAHLTSSGTCTIVTPFGKIVVCAPRIGA